MNILLLLLSKDDLFGSYSAVPYVLGETKCFLLLVSSAERCAPSGCGNGTVQEADERRSAVLEFSVPVGINL